MFGTARGPLRVSLRVETMPGRRAARYPLSARLSANRPNVIRWSASGFDKSEVRTESRLRPWMRPT
jgi:hypothetical protein